MDNKGPDTNNSRFMIHFNKDHELDEHNIVFGRIIHNYQMMGKMEGSQCTARNPVPPQCRIIDCGELLGEQKLTENDGLTQYSPIEPEKKEEPQAQTPPPQVDGGPQIEDVNDFDQDKFN